MEDVGCLVFLDVCVINLTVYSYLDIVFFCVTNLVKAEDMVIKLPWVLNNQVTLLHCLTLQITVSFTAHCSSPATDTKGTK